MQVNIRTGYAFLAGAFFLAGLSSVCSAAQTGVAAPANAPSQAMADILDIKPPVPVGIDDILLYVAAVIAAVLLILALIYWQRHRQGIRLPAAPQIPRHETALRALGDLAGMPPSQGKAFYFRLGEALRVYLQQRFQIGAPEMTTEELTPQLSTIAIAESDTHALVALFRGSDLVKFADVPATAAQMNTDLSAAMAFVTGTAPQVGNAEAGGHGGTRVPARAFS